MYKKITIFISLCLVAMLTIEYYRYQTDCLAINHRLEVLHDNFSKPMTFFDFQKTKYYLFQITNDIDFEKPNLAKSNSLSKFQNIINTARIGEAIGFLTENTLRQNILIKTFPFGVLDLKKLIQQLQNKNIIAPYGKYNNNYLTSNNKLIFSDDSDLASITYQCISQQPLSTLQDANLFNSNLAKAFIAHWEAMKKSGEYGVDGLYYGKRGYSKSMLLALHSLAMKDQSKKNWYQADSTFVDTSDNGPLLRSWVIGLEPRVDAKMAYHLGYQQSQITSSNIDIAIVSGSIAETFKNVILKKYKNKNEVIDSLLQLIINNSYASSSSIQYIRLGKILAKERVNPILVYNEISGFKYDEFLTLLTYSFLYFDNYKSALLYIVHTPGDNDSLAFVLGALFAAYSNDGVNPEILSNIEVQSWGAKKNFY